MQATAGGVQLEAMFVDEGFGSLDSEALQQALAALEVEKSRLTIKAREDGKILKVMYQVGEIVPAGSPAVLLESNRQ